MNRKIADIIFEIEVCVDKLRFILNNAAELIDVVSEDVFKYVKALEETNSF